MRPFADDEGSVAIGELTAENGTARVSIYGELQITRDKAGLKQAQKLKSLVDALVEALEGDTDLPAKVADEKEATIEVKNPFA